MSIITDPLIFRSEWLLDPEVSFLNHGSFGAVPRAVVQAQRSLQEEMEHNPTEFLTCELPKRIREAAEKLASFLGGVGSDYVFAENATAGCNTILNSLRFARGDEILTTDHGYPAVLLAAQQIARRTGATIVQAKVPFPLQDDAQVIAAVEPHLSSRTRLVIFDHVTSPTALLFPVHELTALCRKAGARVLVDGAHAPGMLTLDIPAIKADWYVGNCHKWLMAPKGSAFIWASPACQAEIHPLVTSHGSGQGFMLNLTGSEHATRRPGLLLEPRSIGTSRPVARRCDNAMLLLLRLPRGNLWHDGKPKSAHPDTSSSR